MIFLVFSSFSPKDSRRYLACKLTYQFVGTFLMKYEHTQYVISAHDIHEIRHDDSSLS